MPGRIEAFLYRIKEVHADIEPDTCFETGNGGLILEQRIQDSDSSLFPYGYATWFNAEYGYMDSACIRPLGPSLRIKSITVADRAP